MPFAGPGAAGASDRCVMPCRQRAHYQEEASDK